MKFPSTPIITTTLLFTAVRMSAMNQPAWKRHRRIHPPPYAAMTISYPIMPGELCFTIRVFKAEGTYKKPYYEINLMILKTN